MTASDIFTLLRDPRVFRPLAALLGIQGSGVDGVMQSVEVLATQAASMVGSGARPGLTVLVFVWLAANMAGQAAVKKPSPQPDGPAVDIASAQQ